MFCRDVFDSFMDKTQRPDHRNRGVKTFATKADTTEEDEKCQIPCHMWRKNHHMDNCKNFLELSVNERSRYLAKNKLLFGCYDLITSNHSVKTCTKRIICRESLSASTMERWSDGLVVKLLDSPSRVQNHQVAPRSTQPFILLRLIKWVPGISENLVVKSKLSPRKWL